MAMVSNVSLTFNNTAGPRQSQAGGPGQIGGTYISGLGNVGHINRVSLTKKSTQEDIASDDFVDNEVSKGKSLMTGSLDSGVESTSHVKKRVASRMMTVLVRSKVGSLLSMEMYYSGTV